MSRTHTPRRPTGHDYKLGELVTVRVAFGPCEPGDVVQVIGFRGNTLLRLLPVGGIPVLASHEAVNPTGFRGSKRPPQQRRFTRRPRAAKPAPAAA